MVRGLALFRDHFVDQSDKYVLIGGTACDILMEEAGLRFRATKDLDVVLFLETMDSSFMNVFWEFIRNGGYRTADNEKGDRRLYRFKDPAIAGFPAMLELFSRRPDILGVPSRSSHLTPIPACSSEASSLSAILTDNDYYRFLHSGVTIIDGIPVAGADRMIPMKMKAWLDLKDRTSVQGIVNSRNIRKHRNDVFRLFRIVPPEPRVETPASIKQDVEAFLHLVQREPIDLKRLGLGNTELEDVLRVLHNKYLSAPSSGESNDS